MKLFLPTFKDAFRLVNPYVRSTPFAGTDITVVPAGTVVRLDRFRLNKTTNLDKSWVSFIICASPEPRLAMKKHGGSADFGTSLSMLLREARELDVEIVEDFK